MVDKLSKYTKWLLIAMLVITVILMLVTVIGGESAVDYSLNYGYVMICIAVVAMLFSPIYGIIINPGSLKGILVAIVAAAVVSLIAWLMSKGVADLPAEYLEQMGVGRGVDHFATFCVDFLYIMVAAVVLAIIYSAVSKLVRK